MLRQWQKLAYCVVLAAVADYAKARKTIDRVQRWPDGPGKDNKLLFLEAEVTGVERFLRSQYCSAIVPEMSDGGETLIRYIQDNYKKIGRQFLHRYTPKEHTSGPQYKYLENPKKPGRPRKYG